MGYIDGFGFKIYRLREAKTDNEFLLFNKKENKYNTYSQKRLKEVLLKEFDAKNIDYKKFIGEDLLDRIPEGESKEVFVSHKTINSMMISWIDTETILIDNIGFRPTSDNVYSVGNKTYFNTFEIPESLDSKNYIADNEMSFNEFKKLAPNHVKLLMNLHGMDEKAVKDTLYKLADKVQNPHEKAQDCIIFYPGEGAGKGIFYKYIIQAIFDKYCSKILMKKLNNDFNAYLRNSLVLVLEEGRRDLELVETLKEIVTEGTMLINEKGRNQTEEEIYFLTFVFSNQQNPIDMGKRRGSYHMSKPLGKNLEETQNKGAELCEKLPSETKYLLEYLHNLDVEHQKALMPFNTLAKALVHDLNKTTLELFYDFVCTFESMESAISYLYTKKFYDRDIPEYLTVIGKDDNKETFITKDIIRSSYNWFCFLEGFKSNLIKHNKDIVQLWTLMNIPEDSFKRIQVSSGQYSGRKLDHIKLNDINNHIIEVYKNG